MVERRKVLIVDDDQRMLRIYREQFSGMGYDILEAREPSEVIRLLRANPGISLVILDILLPKTDGLDLFDLIKRGYPGIKVIISSTYPEDEQRFLVWDADDYYHKTDNISVLMDEVNSLMHAVS